MATPGEVAGMFVARRGAIGAGAAMGAGGLVGAAIAVSQDKKGARSTADFGDVGYLSVSGESLVLRKTKKAIVGLKPKISDEIAAQAPRAQVSGSRLKRGKLISIFEVSFADGSVWEFDVARPYRKNAEEVAQVMGSSVE